MQVPNIRLVCNQDLLPGMSLGGVKCLLGDKQSTNSAYHSILTAHILGDFYHATTNARNNGASVCNVIPDLRNDGVGARNIGTNGRNGCVFGYRKFSLETES